MRFDSEGIPQSWQALLGGPTNAATGPTQAASDVFGLGDHQLSVPSADTGIEAVLPDDTEVLDTNCFCLSINESANDDMSEGVVTATALEEWISVIEERSMEQLRAIVNPEDPKPLYSDFRTLTEK